MTLNEKGIQEDANVIGAHVAQSCSVIQAERKRKREREREREREKRNERKKERLVAGVFGPILLWIERQLSDETNRIPVEKRRAIYAAKSSMFLTLARINLFH